MVGARGKLRCCAGDAVAAVELGEGDDVAVDVAASINREAVERDADDVRRAAGAVDGCREAGGLP